MRTMAVFVGCPFRHTDVDLLAQKLRLQGINKEFSDKASLVPL
jgi:hypothetical protein